MAGKNTIKIRGTPVRWTGKKQVAGFVIKGAGNYVRQKAYGFIGGNRRGDFNNDFNNDFLI